MLRQPLQIVQQRRKVLEELADVLSQEFRLTNEGRRSPRTTAQPASRHHHARHGAVLKTGITDAVRAAISAASERFDVHDAITIMTASQYPFATKNPISAVSGVLRKLARKGDIRLFSKGTGGEASVYCR
jgi:hypothetical protein